MKILLIVFLFSLSISNLYSQIENFENENKFAFTFGILHGGGGLVGSDLEFLLSEQLGLQFGAGFYSFGAGINYHFKPSITSSFISFQYWKQGFGDSFVQSAIGPSYVYRAKKWFTQFQIGIGKTLEEGPAFPANREQPPLMLLYSIGVYLPR